MSFRDKTLAKRGLADVAQFTDSTGGSASDTLAAATNTDALTNSTGGAASATLAAGAGVQTIAIPVSLAAITGAGDVLTTYTPGYAFKVLAIGFAVSVPVTTADKLATLNVEIGTTDVTGGAVALTSANCTPLGAVVSGTAITAANTGTSTDSISVEAASVTAFAEGWGYVLIKLQNMDTANAIASLASQLAKQRTLNGVIINAVTSIAAKINAMIDRLKRSA